MGEKKPSVTTLYVGTYVALLATQALSVNLAGYLAGVPVVDGKPNEEGAECVRRLIDQMLNQHLDVAVTDERPGSFDAELAREIAWDTLVRHAELLRDAAL